MADQAVSAHRYDSISFDLDGTLIDSAPGILASLSYALATTGTKPIVALTPAVIGPPLFETLAMLTGITERNKLTPLAQTFMTYYDTKGFALSLPFGGVTATLEELARAGYALHLATNKRLTPTLQVLEHFGWLSLFRSVYTLDLPGYAFTNKITMLGSQVVAENLDPARTVYVGDRNEDRDAAVANGLAFIGAEWGYGGTFGEGQHSHPVITSFPGLMACLAT